MSPTRAVILAILLVLATLSDLRTRRIPNLLTLPGVALGIALGAAEAGWAGLWQGFLGAAVGAGLLFLPFALGGLGAGDVKLLAVVGAFGGPEFAVRSFLGAALLGGLVSAFLLWRAGRLGATLRSALWNTAALVSAALPFLPLRPPGAAERSAVPAALPYGVAIALGTAVAWLWR